MKCIHPQNAYYRDLLGVRRFYERPCGHCIACLHNQQDAWQIRAYETTREFPMFVYDTLTFRPKDLPVVELSDITDALPVAVSGASYNMLRFYSKDCSVIPYVTRDIIRDWIKRGRELYVYDKGKRPNWRYMIFMEYGPKTSRPHFHLLFWNISKVDYKRYFGIPWFKRYGTTKPTYFNSNSSLKDRSCISRYISKYCSKGVFESPWVTDKLVPKPFHYCSNGLGLGLLKDARFSFFFSIMADTYKFMSIDESYKTGCLARSRHVRDLVDLDIMEGMNVPKTALDAISVYYDNLGRPHALPRYYKQKLLNLLHPNVFSYALQTLLLARADRKYYSDLSRFARSLVGFKGFDTLDTESKTLGLSSKRFDILCRWFASHTAAEARAAAKRRLLALKNHYSRPLRGLDTSQFYGVTSHFLALVC